MAARISALVVLVAVAACATAGVGNPASATGGTYVDFVITDGDALKAAHWTVSPDGTIAFAGGPAAVHGDEMTWKGAMSRRDIDELRALLEQDGWYAGTVAGSGAPKNAVTRVTVKHGDGTRKYDIRGRCPEADRLEALLKRASAARRDAYMNNLPRAGDAYDG